jgi:hypothetical protein
MYREALELAHLQNVKIVVILSIESKSEVPRVYFSRASSAFQRFRNERSLLKLQISRFNISRKLLKQEKNLVIHR